MHKATTAIINLMKVLLADLLNPMILQVGLDTRTSLKFFGASLDYETCCTSLQQDVHRYLDPEHSDKYEASKQVQSLLWINAFFHGLMENYLSLAREGNECASPQPHPFCTNYLWKPMLSAGSSLAFQSKKSETSKERDPHSP